MRVKKALAAVALLGLLHLVSCSKSGDSIVGKWEVDDGAGTLEFLKDGTFKSAGPIDQALEGKYTLVEGNRIKIEPVGFKPVISQFAVSGDELTLTHSDNRIVKYRRVK
jgi:hypothetical protein